jgi:hypothetical protein
MIILIQPPLTRGTPLTSGLPLTLRRSCRVVRLDLEEKSS